MDNLTTKPQQHFHSEAEGGLNVHPKFIKALKAIGSQMQNDTIHSGTAPTEKKSRAEIIYPTME